MYRTLLRPSAHIRLQRSTIGRKFASQTPHKPTAPQKPSIQERTRSRLDAWIVRSPKFFKPTLTALRDAPASYVVSFAVLHEITAIVPLVGLAWSFHRFGWLPPYFAEGKWVIEGVQKFGRYFRKKGWIDEKDEARVEQKTEQGKARQVQSQVSNVWNRGEDAGRLLVEVGTAYAIIKLLLPLRIALSVWAAPTFARFTSRAVRSIMEASKSGTKGS